jgi:hypothetical protein
MSLKIKRSDSLGSEPGKSKKKKTKGSISGISALNFSPVAVGWAFALL